MISPPLCTDRYQTRSLIRLPRIGDVNVNVELIPTSLFTQMRPPCSSMNFRDSAKPSPVPSTLRSEPVLRRGLAITDKLEKIPIRIEEVEAVMIAPVNRRMVGNPTFSEEQRGDCQICVPHPKCMVALAERMM